MYLEFKIFQRILIYIKKYCSLEIIRPSDMFDEKIRLKRGTMHLSAG
jgi:hypothetical protein